MPSVGNNVLPLTGATYVIDNLQGQSKNYWAGKIPMSSAPVASVASFTISQLFPDFNPLPLFTSLPHYFLARGNSRILHFHLCHPPTCPFTPAFSSDVAVVFSCSAFSRSVYTTSRTASLPPFLPLSLHPLLFLFFPIYLQSSQVPLSQSNSLLTPLILPQLLISSFGMHKE